MYLSLSKVGTTQVELYRYCSKDYTEIKYLQHQCNDNAYSNTACNASDNSKKNHRIKHKILQYCWVGSLMVSIYRSELDASSILGPCVELKGEIG